MSNDRFITVQQAAVYISRSVDQIYNLIARRAVPYYRSDGIYYFKVSELEAYIERGRVEALPQNIKQG